MAPGRVALGVWVPHPLPPNVSEMELSAARRAEMTFVDTGMSMVTRSTGAPCNSRSAAPSKLVTTGRDAVGFADQSTSQPSASIMNWS
jgi:hypothetical protein